ncbi:MAG: hypothetical protein KGZ53_10815 [Peptococcaceae bacterium]|nr:hypothetical protein [Peptococcaceae bacterium]
MQQARRRKKFRFKPLRRLLLLAIFFLLVYGILRFGQWTYHIALAPRVKYATVQAVDQSLYQGKAVVVRDELVIAAPKGGIINILVEDQTKVQAGQPIFELVDQSLLSSIDKQLADEAARILGKSSQTDDAVQVKKDQLSSALITVRQVTLRYASLLNQKQVDGAKQTFEDLESAHRTADKIQQEYDLVARSQEQYEAKRQELLSQRSMAITSITAPLNGVVSYRTDDLESKLNVVELTDVTVTMLRKIKGIERNVSNGDRVDAGQAVATVINDGHITLLLETKSLGDLKGAVEVVFSGEVLAADIAANIPTAEEGIHIVALQMTIPPATMLDERLVEISLRAKGDLLVSIPKSAIWEKDDKTYVYIPTDDGAHIFKEVLLRQTLSKSVIVAGLNIGETVVTNPKLVAQKEASK